MRARTVSPFAALLLSACSFVHAQDGDHSATPPAGKAHPPVAQPQGHITGTILCNDTHKPARGALVMVMPLPGESTQPVMGSREMMVRTGNDGVYTADHVAPGEYTVVAFQPGYLNAMESLLTRETEGASLSPARQRELLASNGIAALRAAETARFDIMLQRGATLSGRVLYSDGSPATQITLMLEDTAAKPAKSSRSADEQALIGIVFGSMFTHQSMSTDDEGRFRLSGLKPGSYRLAATQPAGAPMDAEGGDGMGFLAGVVPDIHALRFYAGDTAHRAAAKVFDLRAGDSVEGIEITVPVDGFHSVRGTVTAIDGRLVNMGAVTLTDTADSTLVFQGALDREGTFKIAQVTSGTYTLQVSNIRIGTVQRPSELPADYPDTNLPLQPTNAFADGSISVLVKDGDVTDVRLSVSEVPLPKPDPKQPSSVNNEP